jgi:hypothetical protein
MSILYISNFCELFGFNQNEEPVGRLPIKIGSIIFPPGYVFSPGVLVDGFDIAKNIDNLVLLNYDDPNYVALHMFVPEGTAKKIFVNSQTEKKLYRFGKSTHIQEAFTEGKFLICSALEYIKKEYDEARKDNELVHSKTTSPDGVKISLGKNGQELKTIGDITFSSILPIDCYILCFSYDYDETFYEKFSEVDSCLVINDTIAFQERMLKAFSEKMPDYYGRNSRVTYSRHESTFGVLFSKQKNFIWQREYRFAWQPHVPKRQLDVLAILNSDEEKLKGHIPVPVKVSLGSLRDIATIIEKN